MPRIRWGDMRFNIAKIQRNISHYREHRLGITQAELARDVPEELKAPYSEALRLFATEPGIKGCMTKMILGYRCAETVPGGFTKKLIGEAKRRLREDFVFVGLTEEWDVSICVSPARRACDSSSQRD